MVAAVSTALAPFVVPPAANAAPISPTDTGSFSTADLQAIVATRATHAPRADRAARTLEPRLRPPGALGATAVAVAVTPPPAPPTPVVPVRTYVGRHAAVPPKKTVHNGYGNGGGHYVAPPSYSGGRAQIIVDFVLAQVGESYRMGATGPNVWDCSGLSRAAAALVGVSLPHNADAQHAYGTPITRSQLRAGDLVFWSGHVGIAISATEMVAAANTREGVVRQKIYGTPIAYRRIV